MAIIVINEFKDLSFQLQLLCRNFVSPSFYNIFLCEAYFAGAVYFSFENTKALVLN